MRGPVRLFFVASATAFAGGCTDTRVLHVEERPSPCYDCHGARSNADPAPPPAFWRDGLRQDSHRAHLDPASWHAAVDCDNCHLVPVETLDPGHVDTPLPAELDFGGLARADGATPSYDAATCSNVYCHGATLALGGGSTLAPVWGSRRPQGSCDWCHGLPPPPPHVQVAPTACGGCHDWSGLVPNDPSTHINGAVDLSSDLACNTCHGSRGDESGPLSWAPPVDTSGGTDTTRRGVGAHAQHLQASSWHAPIQCATCHTVPASWTDAGHADSPLPAELTWSGTAVAGNAAPSFDGSSCKNVYCHGPTLRIGGGSTTAPVWTQVDGTQSTCGSCHGLPPPPPHLQVAPTACGSCHDWSGLVPNDPTTHINGSLDGDFSCGACHDVAPTTGAHPMHYGESSTPPRAVYGDLSVTADYEPDGLPVYLYGCGNCHPRDPSRHMNGDIDIELYDATAPPSLKSLNPETAAYDGSTCSDVYCHSNGQSVPVFAQTPDWHSGTLPVPRCAGCHDNPPAYPSGGAGTATANSHVVVANDGYEFGHFGGLPGPWHTTYHGGYVSGKAAAPITCQTCHYDSVNPDDTGPGGFYWLSTTGNYDLGGNLGFDCLSCHTGVGSDPPAGSGRAWSKAHANGSRDVVFDPRTSIPSEVGGLPEAPNTPTLPYWVTAQPYADVPDSARDGSTTWSLHLANASYDPQTKTCTNVPCHLNQSFGTGQPAWEPLAWGLLPVGVPTCNACHQF